MEKKLFKNLSEEEVSAFLLQNRIEPSRSRELFTWIYERNTASFDDIPVFPKKFRKRLSETFVLSPLSILKINKSSDGTVKILFKTHDSLLIESVFIINDKSKKTRYTACISTQAGCAMGCAFCATAKIGFVRNLETAEILEQVSQLRRITGIKNNNVVFMGMGEPMNNYDNVMKAAEIMNYTFGFHISNYRITISTCGILPGIMKFIDEKRPYNLAISLNDSDFSKRKVNMPVERKYPFSGIVDHLKHNMPVTKNRVLFEYVMRSDNISAEDVKRLKEIVFTEKILLNCILLNKGRHSFITPGSNETSVFFRELEKIGITYTIRDSFGSDIDAACGQLAADEKNFSVCQTEKQGPASDPAS